MNKEKVMKILNSMTLDEKISQLIMLDHTLLSDNGVETGPQKKLGLAVETVNNIGSLYNIVDRNKLREIQENYLKKSRHKIPLLFCADVIYGLKSVMPIPLGFACSWNPDLVNKCMELVSKECYDSGIHVVFSPMLDLVRDPRWGRVMESTGEDAFLNSCFAEAQVKGLQKDLGVNTVASCIKHFAAYGAPEAGREYNTVDMSERKLHQDYLPAYKKAIEAGAKMVMTSFNTINGIPVSGNKEIMNDLLRNQWGFNGVVVSDYAAIQELIDHGVAETPYEAAKMGIEATVDFDMKTSIYANNLKKLVTKKVIDETLIDKAVLRILTLKNDLGLFENPYRGIELEKDEEKADLKNDFRSLSEESIVLLKNDNNVLPLNIEQKIALIGPYAHEKNILGMWSFLGEKNSFLTIKELMENMLNDNLKYSFGSNIMEDLSTLGFKIEANNLINDDFEIEKAVKIAKESDIIVTVLGEHTLESGEGGSRTKLEIYDKQIKLLMELKKLNKPIVCVLFNGRPLILKTLIENVDSLLEVWYPGTEGTKAIVDILYGKINPSGKITMSFPESIGQIPIYYNEFKTGRPLKESSHFLRFTSRYLDSPNEPLFPFGFGLSYTTFEYSNITISKDKFKSGEEIEAKIIIKNTGKYKGKEIVQMYIQDIFGSVVRPVKELKGFRKIELKVNESKEITFKINEELLKFYKSNMEYGAETGEFILFIGKNSQDLNAIKFKFIKN